MYNAPGYEAAVEDFVQRGPGIARRPGVQGVGIGLSAAGHLTVEVYAAAGTDVGAMEGCFIHEYNGKEYRLPVKITATTGFELQSSC